MNEDASVPPLGSSGESQWGGVFGPSGGYVARSEDRHPVRPTKRIADAVVALLVTQILLLGAEALALIHRIRIVERVRAGHFVTRAEVEHADTLVIASLVAWVVLFVVTGIVWCVWQHRAQRNAIELAYGKLKFTPGWAVGWWFVPFANLVKPFQTVRELWKASHGGYDGPNVATWRVIGWWWGLWLGANVLERLVVRSGPMETVSDFIRSDTWEIVANGVLVVAAILAIMIVRSVVALQERAVAPPLLASVPPMPIAGVLVPEMPPPPPAE
jgi:Domain of unknown function (DUF4328)